MNTGQYFHKKAFTLSEVLITLGIIGVVAALTIPAMVNNTQATETVSKLKKVYATLSSAYTLAVQENGTPENWNLPNNTVLGSANMINALAPYLEIINHCGTATSCYPKTYPMYSNTEIAIPPNVRDIIHLSDGTLIRAYPTSSTCLFPVGTTSALSNSCGIYNIDTNGFKGPNKAGVDQFDFWLTKYGIIPLGTKDETYYPFVSYCIFNNTGGSNGLGCTAWVILNGNMDYKKCSGLSWTGSTSCN